MAWEHEGILGAMCFANEEGETAFELKRKEGYGSTYYLFRVYLENFNEEQKREWPAAWALIRGEAARRGLPLYDYQEICDAVESRLTHMAGTPKGKRAKRKADETGEKVFVEDIRIKVFDHATGAINELTLGISTAPVGTSHKNESKRT